MASENDYPDVRELKRRREQERTILEGTLPPTESRLAGLPPCRNSEDEDRRLFVQSLVIKHTQKLGADARSMLELAGSDGSVETLLATAELVERLEDPEALRRLELYAALAGDAPSAASLGRHLLTVRGWSFSVNGYFRVALGLGLLKLAGRATTTLGSLLDAGAEALNTLRQWEEQMSDATVSLEVSNGTTEEEPVSVLEALTSLADGSAAVGKDDDPADGDGLVVVPAYSVSDLQRKNAARDVAKSLEPLAGKSLPLIRLGDPSLLRRPLTPHFPHFQAELDLILQRPLPWRLLLLGQPGAAKTEFARRLLETVGLPYLLYNSAGASDSSFIGTSAQWGTARPSVPLQLINRHRVANPAILLDELDKTSLDRRNGALTDALLNLLEPVSASRAMDLGLELEVNLSQVSYVATANDLHNVPAPLRDRFKIIRMPSPGREHLDRFVSTILDDIAGERSLDRRWVPDLAQDELELLSAAWPGGSLRRLRRMVELLIEARDSSQGQN